MADCSNNFKEGKESFLNKITLSSEKESQLRKSRNALREKLRNSLKEKDVKNIKFYQQGSYAHRTIIETLDGDYDIDDGIYMDLSDLKNEPSTSTIHDWIKDAAKGHTSIEPEDKEACVRAKFKAGYHVDLPAYKVEENSMDEKYYLAKRKAGWEENNPRAMTDWLKEKIQKNSEQLRRIVKYFKGCKDFRDSKSSIKFPNGLTLTILAGEEYRSDIRDDIAFHETAKTILERLKEDDNIMKPYNPTENMRNYLSDAQFDHFLKELEYIVERGEIALDEKSENKAAKEWQKLFGDRFPVYEDSDDGDKSAKSREFGNPAIIGTTMKSA
jgi:hypothetical protein